MTEVRETVACFGARCSVLVAGEERRAAADVAAASRRLLAWHDRFTRFSAASELSRLNADPRATVPASGAMALFVQAVVDAAEATGGLVDGTLLGEVERAGYRGDLRGSLPLEVALRLAPRRRPAEARAEAAWRALQVDPAARTITRPPGVRLDSGGLAKGLFADLLAGGLGEHASFAIDCAGDVRLGGDVEREVRVASPFDGSTLHTFGLAAGGVATSGIGRRSWLGPDARPAHHLLDPATGRPAFTGLVQVTALAPTALEAEWRAKAALLSGPDGAARWLPHGGVVVHDDGRLAVAPRRPPRHLQGDSQEAPRYGDETGPMTATASDSQNLRVLVVDDEPNIADVISMALRYEGFDVETAANGHDALAGVESYRPHLMVLDIMLPDMEGFEVARRLGGERAELPIVFLTARDTQEDKIRGLTTGGDDYVTKPFSLEELVARIRVILRRAGHAASDSSKLVFADLELDEDTREITRDGRPIELTATEYRLLRYLMLNPRRVLTRAQLLDHVWDYDFGGDARVLETYISYLRKKVDADRPPLIHTVRGVGYSLRQPRS